MRYLLSVIVLAWSALTIGSAAAASLNCPSGKTSTGACVNPRLAQLTQRGTLVFAQLQMNHNFSSYLPANPSVERMYPAHDVVFFQVFINTNP
ncbi:MAG TPA: hypothetical protein VIY51_01335 [Xanthobacteraceae bacterium]